jgi:clan AA aspartic protease (TIGR02281 family)
MIQTKFYFSSSPLTHLTLWALLIGCVSTATLVSAGEMYRWVDEQGRFHLTDTPPKSKRDVQDLKVYKPSETSPQSEPSAMPSVEGGRSKLTPTKPGGVVVVEAVLNRHLTVPLMLDTGADLTILTKQVAQELRLPTLDRLPKLQFGTAGGVVNFPITTLQSLRVGTAEARDVTVAIDIDGHLPVGLLGMSFLRHFKVTVDHQRGQVKFER